ncbi:MAG: hypothetical protein ACI8WB_004827 [Phenylobacterium sp.]|jgi:hypothetical protein
MQSLSQLVIDKHGFINPADLASLFGAIGFGWLCLKANTCFLRYPTLSTHYQLWSHILNCELTILHGTKA